MKQAMNRRNFLVATGAAVAIAAAMLRKV